MVPQETVLFKDIIVYNIRYGLVNADEEDVRKVANLTQISRFIQPLPECYSGWSTSVG